jgi:hypothetical protein
MTEVETDARVLSAELEHPTGEQVYLLQHSSPAVPYPLPFVQSVEPLILLLLMYPIFAVQIPGVLAGTLQ